MDKDAFRHKGGADTQQGGKAVIVKAGPPFFQGIIGCRLDATGPARDRRDRGGRPPRPACLFRAKRPSAALEAKRVKNGAEPSARDWPAGTTIPIYPPASSALPANVANRQQQPCNPCGCEIGVLKGSNPHSTAPPAVGAPCAPSKTLRRCTFLRGSRQAQARDGGRFRMRWRRKTWCARRTLPHAQFSSR